MPPDDPTPAPPRADKLEPLQVTIAEAARLLRYSERTVYGLLARGELRSVGTGRLRRIPMDELRRWQERHKQ